MEAGGRLVVQNPQKSVVFYMIYEDFWIDMGDYGQCDRRCIGGATGDRTPDLLAASQTLSQLSYGPTDRARSGPTGRGARY